MIRRTIIASIADRSEFICGTGIHLIPDCPGRSSGFRSPSAWLHNRPAIPVTASAGAPDGGGWHAGVGSVGWFWTSPTPRNATDHARGRGEAVQANSLLTAEEGREHADQDTQAGTVGQLPPWRPSHRHGA